jgi:hypothetical protein
MFVYYIVVYEFYSPSTFFPTTFFPRLLFSMGLNAFFQYSYRNIPSLTYLLIAISAVSLGAIISLNDTTEDSNANESNSNESNSNESNSNESNSANNARAYEDSRPNDGANENPSSISEYAERAVESITNPRSGGNNRKRNTTKKNKNKK